MIARADGLQYRLAEVANPCRRAEKTQFATERENCLSCPRFIPRSTTLQLDISPHTPPTRPRSHPITARAEGSNGESRSFARSALQVVRPNERHDGTSTRPLASNDDEFISLSLYRLIPLP